MKRVLLKTLFILLVPLLAGLIIGELTNSIFPVITGALVGLIAFIWISLVKVRHFARAFRNNQLNKVGESKGW